MRSMGLTDTHHYAKMYINKKYLLYSTRSYTQHPIITYSEKESEAVHLKLTQYCKPTKFFRKLKRYN